MSTPLEMMLARAESRASRRLRTAKRLEADLVTTVATLTELEDDHAALRAAVRAFLTLWDDGTAPDTELAAAVNTIRNLVTP